MSAVIENHRWTRKEYEHMVRAGVFDPDQRVELIEGNVINRVPQNEPHAVSVSLADSALRNVFGTGYVIRPQFPLSLGLLSQPEPDIAVVAGAPRDFVASHPQSAVLVVEISSSTLNYDRTTKLALYARHGIPTYWIVNLVGGVLETYEQPLGADYARKRMFKRGETLTIGPMNSTLHVDELLP